MALRARNAITSLLIGIRLVIPNRKAKFAKGIKRSMFKRDIFIPYEGEGPLPEKNQVIYVETEYNELVNKYIERKNRTVTRYFSGEGLQFIFLPIVCRFVTRAYLHYLTGSSSVNSIDPAQALATLLPADIIHRITCPTLVHYSYADKGFYLAEIEIRHDEAVVDAFFKLNALLYGEKLRASRQSSQAESVPPSSCQEEASSEICYSVCETEDNYPLNDLLHRDLDKEDKIDYSQFAPKTWDEVLEKERSNDGDWYSESHVPTLSRIYKLFYADNDSEEISKANSALLDDMQRIMDALKKQGISKQLLLRILNTQQAPGRLIIRQGQLILPEMDNTEIKLSPLDKALYIFLLKHPDGVYFKDMLDYEEELYQIYRSLSPRINTLRLRLTIKRFILPTENLMNVSVSRIKKAFSAVLDEGVAHHYIIKGVAREAKYISLPRNLVVWEE